MRATPLSPELTLAFAGVLWKWQRPRLAQLTMVAFCGLLPKTAQQNFQSSEKVLISEQTGISCLPLLCQRRRPDDN